MRISIFRENAANAWRIVRTSKLIHIINFFADRLSNKHGRYVSTANGMQYEPAGVSTWTVAVTLPTVHRNLIIEIRDEQCETGDDQWDSWRQTLSPVLPYFMGRTFLETHLTSIALVLRTNTSFRLIVARLIVNLKIYRRIIWIQSDAK